MAASSTLQDSRREQLWMFSHPLSKHSMPPKTVQKDPQHLIYKQPFCTPASASLPYCMKMPPLSWGSKAMRMTVYILAVCSLERGCYVPNYTGNFGEATKFKSADFQPAEGWGDGLCIPSSPPLPIWVLTSKVLVGYFTNFQVQILMARIWSLKRGTNQNPGQLQLHFWVWFWSNYYPWSPQCLHL